MRGLMQDSALTVDKILDHAKNWHGDREVVSRSVEGPIVRITYAALHGRAKRVSNLLIQLGVQLGDRVGTLAWNTARHMEAWYGIMGIGAVCHTLNPRLHPEQIAWIVNHAGDKVILVDLTFVPILEQILSSCPTVEHVIVMTDQAHMPAFKVQGVPSMKFGGVHCYETAIAGQSELCLWGGFDENTACGLCYTSGTTGDPKGVLYSHRSNFIHCLVGMQADVLGISGVDVVLPVVPMFHANAWGTAFACPAAGATMVLPGPKMDGASIYELIETEKVTFSAAVPTVWQMLLSYLDAENLALPSVRKVVIGGSACPEAIIRGFQERYQVEVLHAWGMTETSPLGTLGAPNARVAALSYDEQMPYKLKQGRPPLGIEMKLTDDAGNRLPHDGHTFGNLKVKGPFVVGEYFKGAGGHILDDEGFFDTGDVATIDPEGFMQITDRAKDVIKSGGEWISTIDIENIAMGHPKAENAAVIGVLHPKWDERPLLLVKLKPGMQATKEEFIEFLQGKIAKWWMPDDVVFVDDIPLGATGKIDKKLIRSRFADYQLPEIPLAAAMAAAAVAAPSIALRATPDPVLRAPEPPVVPEPAPEPEPVAVAEPPPAQPIIVEPAMVETTPQLAPMAWAPHRSVEAEETAPFGLTDDDFPEDPNATDEDPPTLEDLAEPVIDLRAEPVHQMAAEPSEPGPILLAAQPVSIPPEATQPEPANAEPSHAELAAPPVETEPQSRPTATLAEALIAGAAAAAGGAALFAAGRQKPEPELQPAETPASETPLAEATPVFVRAPEPQPEPQAKPEPVVEPAPVAEVLAAPEPAPPSAPPSDPPIESAGDAAAADEPDASESALAWSPGAEPPRSERVSHNWFGGHKAPTVAEGEPAALPNMPDLTPLGAMAATALPVAAMTAVSPPLQSDDQAAAKRPPAPEPVAVLNAGDGPGLTFPSSLKSDGAKDGQGFLPPPGEEPLAFTPVPTGRRAKAAKVEAAKVARAKAGSEAGAAGHYLNLALLFAFAPVAMIVIGALGVRFLGWSWQEGFVSVMTAGPAPALGWAPAAALVGVLTGVIGLLVAAFAGWKRYWRKAMLVMGVTLATLAGFGLLTAWVGQSPPIHDVATDWSEPMLFSPAVMTARGEGANIVESSPVVPLEAGAYGGRRIADLNAETCPGARPAIVSLQPQRAYAMAKAAIAQSGMALVTDDPAAGRLEATASSLIYGMKDDIIVRVKPQGIGSRIDIRSVSRVGGADMGVNCRRVSGLTTKMAP